MNATHCQSCGLPFDAAHESLIATENDRSKSDYCSFCYKDGEFIQASATIADMIEVGVPHLGRKIGEEAAREQLSAFLPTLRRWQKST